MLCWTVDNESETSTFFFFFFSKNRDKKKGTINSPADPFFHLDHWRNFYGCYIERRRQWQPTPVLLPGKPHRRRSLGAVVHGVARSWTWLSDFTFMFHFHALEKEMATHSSVLAWRISGTGDPGRLPSMGLHRVGHNWSNLAAAAATLKQINK